MDDMGYNASQTLTVEHFLFTKLSIINFTHVPVTIHPPALLPGSHTPLLQFHPLGLKHELIRFGHCDLMSVKFYEHDIPECLQGISSDLTQTFTWLQK